MFSEYRLSALWPSKVERSKRGILDSHGHGMSFPSSEASLITIAFLTFAVFLIKLVLVKKTRFIKLKLNSHFKLLKFYSKWSIQLRASITASIHSTPISQEFVQLKLLVAIKMREKYNSPMMS